MATFEYNKLKSQYGNFEEPTVIIEVEGVELKDAKETLAVTDLEVDMTAGFEASMATFRLHGVYERYAGSFNIDKVKKQLFLGSAVSISVGYGIQLRPVFRGFIAKVHFIIPKENTDEIPSIEVTAMDAKAAMMANRHSLKLKASNWSDAVKEVLDKNPFLNTMDFENSSVKFVQTAIDNTPDKPEGAGDSAGGAGGGTGAGGAGGKEKASDKRMEMVEESDYEFVVKAAKKFNYRFFTSANQIYFAKQPDANADVLLEINPNPDVLSLDVGYDMTGLVKKVQVRTLDSDQGKFVKDEKKSNAKVSLGNKAKAIVDQQTLVYLDPTAENKEEAGYRADYLLRESAYRLGSLELEMTGLPEFTPGCIIQLKGFGAPLDNKFYLTRVVHLFDWRGYRTMVEGSANSISS